MKIDDFVPLAGDDVDSGDTAQMIVAAWGTLSSQTAAIKLGKTGQLES
ncbi:MULTISPECIES: hypothetical protein [Corynebacterium]|jgi:hypothetical protein|uniref:Uncharacterized protein n=1 Tax=Corynebacterium accolens TaxID=38284 RepID=A0AAP4BW91_9CORY|nr:MULTISPECIES: hypothetical protein [Corynebacterium]MDK4209864.1 hypothetical protein [Corynebacterium accolens]MDK4280834.1 hypothetical protein [Corynebacterium accolens]MDK4295353.1 hypothetical protein [Corynebacterium accolens]MDK4310511.1 hypothetical protein [Corynebacterium accolens]MDK4323629.1 hypothetical protein [Corynebacterium accolens]